MSDDQSNYPIDSEAAGDKAEELGQKVNEKVDALTDAAETVKDEAKSAVQDVFVRDGDGDVHVDFTKLQDNMKNAGYTLNQTIEAQGVNPQRATGALASIAITALVAYLAGKRGVKAGMKDFTKAGELILGDCERFTQIAAENARVSYDAVVNLEKTLKGLPKALKGLK